MHNQVRSGSQWRRTCFWEYCFGTQRPNPWGHTVRGPNIPPGDCLQGWGQSDSGWVCLCESWKEMNVGMKGDLFILGNISFIDERRL